MRRTFIRLLGTCALRIRPAREFSASTYVMRDVVMLDTGRQSSCRSSSARGRMVGLPLVWLMVWMMVLLFSMNISPVAANERMVLPNFKPKVTWKVDDNRIVDVCHNYGYGHWKYRRCRMAAVKLFKEKCREAKKAIRSTQGSRQKRARRDKRRFCKTFRP